MRVSSMLSRLRSEGAVAAGAGLLAAAWNAFYLWILWQEGEGDLAETNVRYVAASVGAASLLLLLTLWLRSPSVRVAVLAASAAALTGFALLAAMSIGILLAPAAVLAWVALGKENGSSAERPHPRAKPIGIAVGLAIPAVFLLTLV
jgi:hypothetical protein